VKILFILSQTPYPWWFYGRSSMYFTLVSLSKYADIYVSFPILKLNENSLKHLKNLGLKIYPFKMDTRDKYHKIVLNLFQKYPFKIKKYYSSSYKNFIINLIDDIKPDLIQIHTPHMALYGFEIRKKCPDTPILLRLHDIVIDQVNSFIENNKNPIKKIIGLWQLKKIEKYEIEVWNSFEKSIFITKRDMENAIKYSQKHGFSQNNRFTYIMDGINAKKNLYIEFSAKENSLAFAASDQIQNVESLKRFLEEIWFLIYDKVKFSLNIYGKICNYFKKYENILKQKKVFLKGFIEDRSELDRELVKNKLFISPTVVGSGYRTKILEAGSIGMPVICTFFDFEPLSDYLKPEEDILISDNKEQLLEILRKIEQNLVCLEDISKNFYSKLKNEFSWDRTARKFLSLYREILEKGHEDSSIR